MHINDVLVIVIWYTTTVLTTGLYTRCQKSRYYLVRLSTWDGYYFIERYQSAPPSSFVCSMPGCNQILSVELNIWRKSPTFFPVFS